MGKKIIEIRWFEQPEPHNYPAAGSYLSLIFEPTTAKAHVVKLRKAEVTEFKAKDIFRASGLSLLGVSNSHVLRDQKKLKANDKISPLLLVRDPVFGRVIVADGYHRLCAIYSFFEDAVVRCKIV